MKKLTVILLAMLAAMHIQAGGHFWTFQDQAPTALPGERTIFPETFKLVQMNEQAFQTFQGLVPLEGSASYPEILLPAPDGRFQVFYLFECPMMEAPLAAKYPMIKTYTAVLKSDARVTAKLDFTLFGFHAMVFDGEHTYFIDPLTNEKTGWYMTYYKKDFKKAAQHRMACLAEDAEQLLPQQEAISLNDQPLPQNANKTNGTDKRTYRLALACTVEYSAAVGGATPTKASVLSAMTTSMNRVNGVFERDFAMHANLVGKNDTLIFIGTTDPYTNNNGSVMLGQNQTTVDARILSANYDFGHVFSTGGGGIASLGSVCSSGSKAQGVTGSSNPVGDPFDIDYVAHEMGHQFGGSHTFNSVTGSCSGNRSSTSAYEIGSATTIMGYAGICGTDDIQPHSDDYYHIRSLEQMTNTSVIGCASVVASNNQIPTLNPISATYPIPYRTSFELTASGTDADGDPMTYCWEEWDRGGSGNAWNAKTTLAPIFRSFLPVASATRTFPTLKYLVQNSESYKGELLPDTNRTLKFRCTLRDIKNGYGSFYTSTDTVKLTVTKTTDLFRVTSQSTAPINWNGWMPQTITWNVAGTTAAPFNTSHVDIYLSTDSGKTWPHVLATNTANDGSEVIYVPNVTATWCRVKVKANGNVYFDLNDGWISISAAPNSLNEIQDVQVDMYPNPASTTLHLETNDARFANSAYSIHSLTGDVLMQGDLKQGKTDLDIQALAPGYYQVQLMNAQNQRITRKLIKH
ncbi:MAG: T9SS type A sorting domain-containing protein [Chitinophagaceae bacterium]|nr:T9SS type A sorting domain-containing protein [Chitinophagaceae bacterium]